MNFNLEVVVANQRLHSLRSKWWVHLMSTTFPCYIWIQTGLYSVVALESLEWGIHGLCIPVNFFDLRCESVTYLVNIPEPVLYEIYTLDFSFDLRCESVTYIYIYIYFPEAIFYTVKTWFQITRDDSTSSLPFVWSQ